MSAEFRSNGLVKATALGRQKNYRCAQWKSGRLDRIPRGQFKLGLLLQHLPTMGTAQNRLDSSYYRLGAHYHTAAAAVGVTITGLMTICCIVANIVEHYLKNAIFLRSGQYAL